MRLIMTMVQKLGVKDVVLYLSIRIAHIRQSDMTHLKIIIV